MNQKSVLELPLVEYLAGLYALRILFIDSLAYPNDRFRNELMNWALNRIKELSFERYVKGIAKVLMQY